MTTWTSLCFCKKLDRDGKHLQVQNSGSRNLLVRFLTRHNGSVLKYKAVLGQMRVSLRRLDPDLSTEQVPVPGCEQPQKLQPTEIV